MWTGLNWLRIRSSSMLFEYSNETSRSTECQSSLQGGSLTIQEKLPWMYLSLFFIAGACCRTPALLRILRTGVSVVQDTHRTPSHCLFIAGTCCKSPVQLCILMTGDAFVAQDVHFHRTVAVCRVCMAVNICLWGGNTYHQCLKLCSWT
jgi:hypothetical protein